MTIKKTIRIEIEYGSDFQEKNFDTLLTGFLKSLKSSMETTHTKNGLKIYEEKQREELF